jgi:hypothetical protein
MTNAHSFHIPVMGIGFTIDTPLRVSQYGIDSVISLVDDSLLERIRKMYCGKFEIPYYEISKKTEDFRAKRITSYLNLLNELAEKKFEELKSATIKKGNAIKEYFSMLPDSSVIKNEFKELKAKHFSSEKIEQWINEKLSRGSIDVNIMTKIDRENFVKGEKLPAEYNDAHAALRGYANSNLTSSIVFSAGMNMGLYSYLEQFDDFFPNGDGFIKKKIILKVSDYRSALIQGKLLAKKGLWVSEYRVESGLNCGGHAFATEGFLIGPILEEFNNNRALLVESMQEVFIKALTEKGRVIPEKQLPIKVTAQGGVGTSEEHQFLIDHYKVDSVGWGTPFLLVPQAVNVDKDTLDKLKFAKENDLYLSNISPLGVPFNSLRGNTKDIEKTFLIKGGKPGSLCPKKNVALNNEFTKRGICTASRQYQELKLKELDGESISKEEYKAKYDRIVEKSCICVGLGTSALLVNKLDTKREGEGVSVCPGPNMAYFSKKMKLKEMIDHIYGRANVISRQDRPNMFIKELNIYIDYLKNKIAEAGSLRTPKQDKYFSSFISNLQDGIDYYSNLFSELKEAFKDKKESILTELKNSRKDLQILNLEIADNSKKGI